MHRLHDRCACGSALSALEGGAVRPFAFSGTKRVYERPQPFRIRHIALDLELRVDQKALAGKATLDVTRVDGKAKSLSLDAVGMDLDEVTVDGAAVDFVYDGETLRVPLEGKEEARIAVRYRTVPVRGMYFLAPDEHVRDRPRQVWTQCQDEDARHVFPCHDKPHVKQTMETRVKVPPGWRALGNGDRKSTDADHARGEFAFSLAEPQSSYLFTLVAGEFAEITGEADGIPLAYWVPKGREADGQRTFARTAEMIRHFGKLTGVRYPWTRYTQVVVSDFIFGGMENTTATTMYEHILLDEKAAVDITSDDLIAHELAHQWFGDLVTCRDWSHAWLNEGFATFMENVDHEHAHGADAYEQRVRGDLDAYLGEARGRYKRPIVCQDYVLPIDIFDRHLYEKGGLVLHLLRRELGDEVFWKGVGFYLARHAKGVVETRDLARALEEVSGRSLEQFFEQWVYRAGHPEVEVAITWDDGVLTAAVKQKQTSQSPPGSSQTPETATPLFAFDLEIDIGTVDGVRRETRRVTDVGHTFHFPMAKRPRFVVVDAALRVLGEVEVQAPADMLRTQLESAPTARGRALAAEALAKRVDDPSVRALAACLAKDTEFWGTRATAAEALGTQRTESAFEVLQKHTATEHPKVRRAVVAALGQFRTTKAADLLKKPCLADASYLVEAEAARALGATKQQAALDTLLEVVDRPSWADVVRCAALDGMAALKDERATPHVVARTRYGVSTRGRRAAIGALSRLGSDRKTRETLEDLLSDADPYLRVDVVRALVELGDAKARGALSRQLDRELDGRVKRRIREALRDLGVTGRREQERMREDLETLRGELRELKSKIERIEAKPGSDKGKDKQKRKDRRA